MALTQEIAVIQGPPGTGKTYTGYKIVQTLLENREVWDPNRNSPILVMCFTNHSLDQFLEGIIHHELSDSETEGTRRPKIVRIGGRSQSEEIQRHSLRNVRRRFVPRELYRSVCAKRDTCSALGSSIEWSSSQLQNIVHNPVSDEIICHNGINKLKRFIHPSHLYQIIQLADTDHEIQYTLEIWLGLWSREIHHTEVLKEDGNHGKEQATTDLEPKSSEEEDTESEEEKELVQIKGDAELEEEIRMLDAYDYTPLEAKEKVEDDNNKLSRFIKSKSGLKEARENANHTRVWKRKSFRDRREIFKRIEEEKPMEDDLATDALIPDVTDPSFSEKQKFQLLRLWIKKYEESLMVGNQAALIRYDRLCREYKDANQELDLLALEQAEVIGMTTTGAAKYQHIINLVKPKIVIVEEAAELLESHIVSALNAGTQHLILIGDHKQLRPKPNEYDLAMKHNLHISLFERLIKNGLPHATLMIQHRMRPQIASLVCPHIYDKLENHDSVTKYKDVKGFRKNVYFFHHEEEEQQDDLSHSNEYEADFITVLCRHLLKLGYEPDQITILTAYTGQLLKVKNKMPRDEFEGVRITNVDNFQGEENDIIILSLVRSNSWGNVGFLKEENRVCVALSRARVGLFCFGNFKMLRKEVPIWDRILSQVEEEGCVGSAFPLQCPNHSDMVFDVTKPKEFIVFSPEGGCGKVCSYRLECGHTCRRHCHIDDTDHERYRCQEICGRICENEKHPCIAPCYKSPCPPCQEEVTHSMPRCHHEQIMKCSEDPHDILCEAQCRKLCPNSHPCSHDCWKCSEKLSCLPCSYLVTREMPSCGHQQEMKCHEKPEQVLCIQQCKKSCSAGHPCQKACWEDCGNCQVSVVKKLPNCEHSKKLPCYYEPSQYKCLKTCKKKYPCGHLCQKNCFEECDVNCMLLQAKTIPNCGHIEEVPCYLEPKSWSCKKPCEKVLDCGHPCKSTCGETCKQLECIEPKKVILSCKHIDTVKCKDYLKILSKIHKGEKIECMKPCTRRLKKCGHLCKNKCSEPCSEKCNEVISQKCSKGFHKVETKCGEALPICTKRCCNKMPCGHSCKNKCHEPCSETCVEKVLLTCPCGHKHKVKCGDNHTACICREKCQAVLKCGHKCSGRCGECFTTRVHAPCPYEVYLKRFCGHYASVPCYGLEDACKKDCQATACLHNPNPCKHECHQPCDRQCTEPCLCVCSHQECDNLCFQVCDVAPCGKPCEKILACGHNCLGLCGENCLTRCIICNKKKFLSDVRGIDKKSKPAESLEYIELTCGHLHTVNYLDKYYQAQHGKDRLISPLVCPTCQKITSCNRYMKTIKERAREIEEIRSKIQATACASEDFRLKITSLEMIMRELQPARNYVHSILQLQPSNESLFTVEILTQVCVLYETLASQQSELKEAGLILLQRILYILKDEAGKLSIQVIDDIRKEVYRICLFFMTDKIQKLLEDSPKASVSTADFSHVQAILDKTEPNNSAINQDIYLECVHFLSRIYKQHSQQTLEEPVHIEETTPVVTKGQWYRCAKAGHIYFVPAKYRKGQAPTVCEQCV